jgi:hypothetical protein
MHTGHFALPLLGLLASAALAEPAIARTADAALPRLGTYPVSASAAPLPAPILSPVPAAAPARRHGPAYFAAGDYMYAGTINNEFSPGNNRAPSWTGCAAAEGPIGKFAAMAEVDFRTWQYPGMGLHL